MRPVVRHCGALQQKADQQFSNWCPVRWLLTLTSAVLRTRHPARGWMEIGL